MSPKPPLETRLRERAGRAEGAQACRSPAWGLRPRGGHRDGMFSKLNEENRPSKDETEENRVLAGRDAGGARDPAQGAQRPRWGQGSVPRDVEPVLASRPTKLSVTVFSTDITRAQPQGVPPPWQT